MDYPKPPECYSTEYDEIDKVEVKLFSLGQMQAYLDADRAQRAAPAVDAQPVAVVDANDDGMWADILPDRDVQVGQFLYATAQPVEVQRVPSSVVSGALFDFLGYLTSRDKVLTLSSRHEAGQAVKALQEWAKFRSLPLDKADVQNWPNSIKPASEKGGKSC